MLLGSLAFTLLSPACLLVLSCTAGYLGGTKLLISKFLGVWLALSPQIIIIIKRNSSSYANSSWAYSVNINSLSAEPILIFKKITLG